MKISVKGYQRIVDGLFVIGCGFKNIYFWVVFCALFFRIRSPVDSRTQEFAGETLITVRNSFQT
jgi:hypothetical protein